MAERLRETWPDLVLVVVGTAEEQSKVASQITSGVVYRFLHRPVSAPRVRLFVEAALRRHEVENVERTLEQTRPDFSQARSRHGADARQEPRRLVTRIAARRSSVAAVAGGWCRLSGVARRRSMRGSAASVVGEPPAESAAAAPRAPARRSRPRRQRRCPKQKPHGRGARRRGHAGAGRRAGSAADRSRSPNGCATRRRRRRPRRPPRKPRPRSPSPQTLTKSAPQTPPPPPVADARTAADRAAGAGRSGLAARRTRHAAGRNAVELFRGALELDPGNTLAKAGLVRVADRLLSAAERALTAGNPEDARSMVDVAETLTPATARGAFLMMQIETEHERAALTRAKQTPTRRTSRKRARPTCVSRTRACAAARSSNLPRTTRASTWKPRARSSPTIRRSRKPRARCRRSC